MLGIRCNFKRSIDNMGLGEWGGAGMNQKEIAERLNLSRTTVSRCFTNHPKINPETRARVFELATELGYM